MSTKDEIKQAELQRKRYRDKYLSLFYMLYHNSVKIINLPKELPKRYLLNNLLRRGGIAYDYETKLYLPYTGMLINTYGLPEKYQLYGYNGFNVIRKKEDVSILRANDLQYPISIFIEQQVEKIVNIDMTILQNLNAIKTTTVISVSDKSGLLSLANAEMARQVGSSLIFVDKNMGLKEAINAINTGATYNGDKLNELRTEVINETLNVLGIPTANTSKRERVQSSEITASNGLAINCIETLVDTFNYDAEVGNVDIRFEVNTKINTQINTKINKGDNIDYAE